MADEKLWPDGYDPPPDDWVWTLVDVTCAACGAVNVLHEQPPQWLDTDAGVTWECTNCQAHNRLGGHDPAPPSLTVFECAHCHATFDPNAVDVDDDNAWTCSSCSVVNRDVTAGEHASSVEVGQ